MGKLLEWLDNKKTLGPTKSDARWADGHGYGHIYQFPIVYANYNTKSVIERPRSPYNGENDFLIYVGRTIDIRRRLSEWQNSTTGIELYDPNNMTNSTNVEFEIYDSPEHFFVYDYSTIELRQKDNVYIDEFNEENPDPEKIKGITKDLLDAQETFWAEHLKNEGYSVCGGK